MSNILWMDGFENYGTNSALLTQGLWDQADGTTIDATQFRTGTYGCRLGITTGKMRRPFGGDIRQPGCTFGLYLGAMPTVNNGGHILAQFRDSTNRSHIGIKIGSTGRIIAIRSGLDQLSAAGTVLGQSTLEIAPGSWNHIEVHVKLHASAGFVKVKVNGKSFLSLTGINTLGDHTSEDTAAQVAFGWFDSSAPLDFVNGTVQFYIDDVVVIQWAEDGSEDTNFLGLYGVYYLKPTSDTAVADWDFSTGSTGWNLINEVAPDDNAKFIFTSGANNKAAFDTELLPANITSIAAVQPTARCKKTDTGDGGIKLAVISQGTEDISTDEHPLTTNFAYYFDVWMTDPHTSSAWSPTHLPEIEIERSV